jgi:transposase-like protein
MFNNSTTETVDARGRDFLGELLRSGARRILAAALDAEVEELLKEYASEHDAYGRRRVVRNGYLPERDLTTPLGAISVKVPRVRDRSVQGGRVKFESKILPLYLRRTKQMDELLPWLYLKGISTGDFGEALSALLGPSASGVSASTVCRLKEQWQSEYEIFSRRDLSEKRYAYFWADGIYFGVRSENADHCFLVILGVREDGDKELVGLWEGYAESADSWRELLMSLKHQGLSSPPKLVVADGAGGLRRALAEVFPGSQVQCCWVHKVKNVLSHLPKSKHNLARSLLKEIWNAPDRRQAELGLKKFSSLFSDKTPKAVESLLSERERLLAFYDFPAAHWKHLRTTNPIESVFATVRLRSAKTRGMSTRRTIGAMVYKLCQSASKGWRKIDGTQNLVEVLAGKKFVDGELLNEAEVFFASALAA